MARESFAAPFRPLMSPGEERHRAKDQADIEAQAPHQVLALVIAETRVEQAVAEGKNPAEPHDHATGCGEEAGDHQETVRFKG